MSAPWVGPSGGLLGRAGWRGHGEGQSPKEYEAIGMKRNEVKWTAQNWSLGEQHWRPYALVGIKWNKLHVISYYMWMTVLLFLFWLQQRNQLSICSAFVLILLQFKHNKDYSVGDCNLNWRKCVRAYLWTSEDDWFSKVLKHKWESRSQISHGIGAMKNNKAMIFLIVLLNLQSDFGPILYVLVLRMDDHITFLHLENINKDTLSIFAHPENDKGLQNTLNKSSFIRELMI